MILSTLFFDIPYKLMSRLKIKICVKLIHILSIYLNHDQSIICEKDDNIFYGWILVQSERIKQILREYLPIDL